MLAVFDVRRKSQTFRKAVAGLLFSRTRISFGRLFSTAGKTVFARDYYVCKCYVVYIHRKRGIGYIARKHGFPQQRLQIERVALVRPVIFAQISAFAYHRVVCGDIAVRLRTFEQVDMLDCVCKRFGLNGGLGALFKFVGVSHLIKKRIHACKLQSFFVEALDVFAYAGRLAVFVLGGKHGRYGFGQRVAHRIVTEVVCYTLSRAQTGKQPAHTVEQFGSVVLRIVEHDCRVHISAYRFRYFYIRGKINSGGNKLVYNVVEQAVFVEQVGI